MPPIARVEPLTTARALRGPFDYRLPPALADVAVGTLLAVPFAGRELLGVVVERALSSDVPAEKLAEPRARVEPAIPAELVELARWIAAEYCSTFSRALQLVLPPGAGRAARPRVRVREVLVAEATAAGRAALADSAGERLTERQRAVLARLAADGPLPATATGADHGGLRRLAGRGLIVLEARAQRRRPLVNAVGARSLHAPALTDEQRGGAGADPRCARRRRAGRSRRPPLPAARRHRLRQDGGLPAGGGGGARREQIGARAGAGDRARAADGRALPGALRRHRRGAALAARPGRALRRVAAARERRVAHLRRPALGRVRAAGGPRPRDRRRGARAGLQARGRSALRRAPRRRAPRAAGGRGARQRQRDATAGERPRAPAHPPHPARRRPSAAADRGARHARRAPSAAPDDARGARRRAARRTQGDRPRQPPRLVELPLLPLVRARVELPAVRRRARAAPARWCDRLPPLRSSPADPHDLHGVPLLLRRTPRRRHRADRDGAAGGTGGPGVPGPAARRRHRARRQGRRGAHAGALRPGGRRRAGRHADGCERATTSRT